MPTTQSFERYESVTLVNRLALLHVDHLHDAGLLGLDGHLHLHRLEDHDCVALVHRVSGRDLDLPHGAGYVCLDLRQFALHFVGSRSAPEYPAVSPEPDRPNRVVIVTARDEADRIQATIGAIQAALPGARVVLAESGSRDRTAALAKR